MKKLLIIGIDSFTGRHLSSFLSLNGFDVYGTSMHCKDYKVYKCNIIIQDELKVIINNLKPDYIINLVAISSVVYQDRNSFYQVNTLGVENLLESILATPSCNPAKIILVSSATVYGDRGKTILNEDFPPNPIGHYALSKFAMEQIAKVYFNKLNLIVVRPFNYTGIGQSNIFLIPKIVKYFKDKKLKIDLGNLNIVREFNDIKFVCESYKRLLLSNVNSEIVNIASSRSISLKKIINNMEKIAGYKIKIQTNSKFIRENDIKELVGSSDKLFDLIGIVKQKNISETLKDIYCD